MEDSKLPTVYWSHLALIDSETIRDYLEAKFSQREIDSFYSLLFAFEKNIIVYPELYAKSAKNSEFYRAVLSKQLSVFYNLNDYKITVVAILDNRMGYSKWP